MTSSTELPRIGAPATRALESIGVRTLNDLRGKDLNEIAELHGVGPRAIALLKEALAQPE